MDWGPVGILGGLILSATGMLWKVRRDEISDLKEFITDAVGPLQKEVERLREWRHDFGQKEMVYDDHGRRIQALEDHRSHVARRLDSLESHGTKKE
jgi:hypothetical protein